MTPGPPITTTTDLRAQSDAMPGSIGGLRARWTGSTEEFLRTLAPRARDMDVETFAALLELPGLDWFREMRPSLPHLNLPRLLAIQGVLMDHMDRATTAGEAGEAYAYLEMLQNAGLLSPSRSTAEATLRAVQRFRPRSGPQDWGHTTLMVRALIQPVNMDQQQIGMELVRTVPLSPDELLTLLSRSLVPLDVTMARDLMTQYADSTLQREILGYVARRADLRLQPPFRELFMERTLATPPEDRARVLGPMLEAFRLAAAPSAERRAALAILLPSAEADDVVHLAEFLRLMPPAARATITDGEWVDLLSHPAPAVREAALLVSENRPRARSRRT